MGDRVAGFGFGVWGLGLGVWGLRFGVRGLGCGVQSLALRVWGFQDLELRVYGLGFGVWVLGFRVQGTGQARLEMHATLPCREKRYRGTLLIRNRPPLGPYSGYMPRPLCWSQGVGAVSFERRTPVTEELFQRSRSTHLDATQNSEERERQRETD